MDGPQRGCPPFALRAAPHVRGTRTITDNRLRLEIRRSRFAVVDLTYNNPGAYWEAGLSEGVGRNVFFTCRKGEAVHFDTRQSYIIFWEPDKLPDAARRLKEAIRVTIPEAKQDD